MVKTMIRLLIPVLVFLSAACSQVQNGPDADLILVAGATGRTGQHIVKQLQESGYKVRALVRDRDSASEKLGQDVELVVGDVTQPDTLEPAFKRVSKVISAIGSSAKEGPGSPEYVDYAGNNNLANAALAANVQQFVLVSSMGVTHEDHPLNKMMGNVLVWKFKSEEYLRNSGLNYTIIRPGGLHDKAGGEQLIVFEQADIVKVVAIARADVAAVCVAAIEYPAALNKTFEVFTVKAPPDRNWQAKFGALN